jgi:hypothetical protein
VLIVRVCEHVPVHVPWWCGQGSFSRRLSGHLSLAAAAYRP